MPSAPAVQNLQDIVSQYTNADAPQSAAINNEITANDASGATQVQGLNDAKTQAFQGIDQKANDNGMYFSGFRPDQQATYTGSTYLPALAKLQTTIAGTRNTLLGQKAALQTDINRSSLTTQQDEQKQLDAWNGQQAADATALQRQQEAEQAAASLNTANNANRTEAANISANSRMAAANTSAGRNALSPDETAIKILQKGAGADTFVSPNTFRDARAMYMAAGGNNADFMNKYWRYTGANTNQKNHNNWRAYYN